MVTVSCFTVIGMKKKILKLPILQGEMEQKC